MSIQVSIEKAKRTGILNLKCTKKENILFLKSCKLMLDEVHTVDLSSNKLTKIPSECLVYNLMERLIVCDNALTSVPETILVLKLLVSLDLSRNQLKHLPTSICHLPSLEILTLNNNDIDGIPEEINLLKNLVELDVACNAITEVPHQIGDVISLRSLNLRKNLLKDVAIEISFLPLLHLDLSSNNITSIPVDFIFMNTLVHLNLEGNPLISPPMNICVRGKYHIFKYLYEKAIKEDNKLISLQDKQYNMFYKKKNTAVSPFDEFKFSNSFVAKAIRNHILNNNCLDYNKSSKRPVKRRNAFRSPTEDNHLTMKFDTRNLKNPKFNQNRKHIKTEIADVQKIDITSIQMSEDEKNMSKYRKEKFTFPPARIEKPQINERRFIQESFPSYNSTSSAIKAQTLHSSTLLKKSNNEDVLQNNKIDLSGNQLSIIDCAFIVTLPILFLAISIYTLIQLIFNRGKDTLKDIKNESSNI